MTIALASDLPIAPPVAPPISHQVAPATAAQGIRLDITVVAAEIASRIAAEPVRLLPFPHLVIDDLLPGSIRQALDGYWPDRQRMAETNCAVRGELRVSRIAEAAQGREQMFWRALRGLTTMVGRAVRARLEPHLAEKFRPLLGSDWQAATGALGYDDNDAMLAHYTGQVDLPPHIDHARVVINSFVYLSDGDRPAAPPLRGTMLYRSLGFAWPTNRQIPKQLRDMFLREAGEVEWRDNRLLAYVNGPSSFHGVPPHDIGDQRRRLLMFGSLLDKDTTARIYDETLR